MHPGGKALCTAAARTEGLNIKSPQFGNPHFDKQPAAPLEQAFRHSGWSPRRNKTWASMQRTGAGMNRQQSFGTCGAGLWAQRSPGTDEVRLVANCCHDRWCVPCATARARRINANLTTHCKGKSLRFITLTLKHSMSPLADQLNRLHRSFAELRRRKDWKEHVTGGAAFIECKVSARDGLWHPHLHIICEGSFWRQADISAIWYRITGDSSIVHLRQVTDLQQAAAYVVKYVTKPADQSVYNNQERLDEMMVALRGTKLCATFGTWRALKLTEVPADGKEWVNVKPLESIILGAAAGDPDDVAWFRTLSARYTHLPWPTLDLPPPVLPNQLPLSGL